MTQPEVKEKRQDPQHQIILRVPRTVEACSERLETLADEDPLMESDVALLPKNGQWAVTITRNDTNPFKPNFTKIKFSGHLERTKNDGALLLGQVMLDPATFVTRGVYLALLGPPLILIGLRLGFVLPIVGLACIAGLGALLYMLILQPEQELKKQKSQLINRIEDTLR